MLKMSTIYLQRNQQKHRGNQIHDPLLQMDKLKSCPYNLTTFRKRRMCQKAREYHFPVYFSQFRSDTFRQIR